MFDGKPGCNKKQPGFFITSTFLGSHVPRRRLTLAGLMSRIRFPRGPLNDRLVKPVRRLTVRMIFMGPHVPRRRFSFARRECGVRFSKVPLSMGAHVPRSARRLCKPPGRIRFPSLPLICTISLIGRALGYEPKDWVSTT